MFQFWIGHVYSYSYTGQGTMFGIIKILLPLLIIRDVQLIKPLTPQSIFINEIFSPHLSFQKAHSFIELKVVHPSHNVKYMGASLVGNHVLVMSVKNGVSPTIDMLLSFRDQKTKSDVVLLGNNYNSLKGTIDIVMDTSKIEFGTLSSIGSIGSFSQVTDPARCQVCLLYTSPSPRDKRQSRMPSSA